MVNLSLLKNIIQDVSCVCLAVILNMSQIGFKRLANIEPNTYKFIMKSREEGGLGYREVMDYLGIPYETLN